MTANSETIRSRQNALLKRVRAVASGKERGVLLLEGERLVLDAVAAGAALEAVLAEEDHELPAELAGAPVRRVQAGLLQGLGTLHTEPSVVALAQPPAAVALEDLPADPGALLLVVAGVADPGNLGALARSAEAAGATAMVSLLGGVSPWHPRALRGSMGSLLRLPVVRGLGAQETRALLNARGWRSIGAATRGGRTWRDADWSGPVALWVSGETGEEPEALADLERVTIPMAGGVESLNVTVAASLLLFAAGRTGA